MEFQTLGEMASAVDDEKYDFEDALDGVSVIPGSLCMACGGSGVTRLMMTKIPYFRELILSSFQCDECTERNNEIQFGGEIQERGVRYALTCHDAFDLDRQVIKSDTCRILVPALELEIPAATQRGTATTVEGVLSRAARELGLMQAERRSAGLEEQAAAIQKVVDKLEAFADARATPFSIELVDPAGNSFVQSLNPGGHDARLERCDYNRTDADDIAVGLRPGGSAPVAREDEESGDEPGAAAPKGKHIEGIDTLLGQRAAAAAAAATAAPVDDTGSTMGEAMQFAVDCPHCHVTGLEQMCTTNIPHFKEVIIMSFHCAPCGYRNAEIKGGGAVPKKGAKVTLVCVDMQDLMRDVLKSDTASFELPSLELELVRGSLGSVYTTIEGALKKVRDRLAEANPFSAGDSADTHGRGALGAILLRIDALIEGTAFPFEIVIEDPLANSFIGPRRDANWCDPLSAEESTDEPDDDDNLSILEYTRSWDEDEELGLNDIDTGDPQERANTNTLGAIHEDGDDDDDDDKPTLSADVRRAPPRIVDHPNPNFARGCDDAVHTRP